jgi:hypothetical protein
MTETTGKDIERGNCRNAANLIAELDRRLAEDDANPDDIVGWETIRAEAQARYNQGKTMAPQSKKTQLRNESRN